MQQFWFGIIFETQRLQSYGLEARDILVYTKPFTPLVYSFPANNLNISYSTHVVTIFCILTSRIWKTFTSWFSLIFFFKNHSKLSKIVWIYQNILLSVSDENLRKLILTLECILKLISEFKLVFSLFNSHFIHKIYDIFEVIWPMWHFHHSYDLSIAAIFFYIAGYYLSRSSIVLQ